MGILSTLCGKVLNFTGSHLGYVLSYSDNIKKLEEEVEMLNAARTVIERKVEAARNNDEIINETVIIWMGQVDEITAKGAKFLEEESDANTGCFLGSCPNLWLRYKLSREAKNMAAKIDQLKEEGKFDEIATPQMPPQVSWVSPLVGEAFESRVSKMKEIMEALINPAVHLIGLYGPPGVGKTTLAKQVEKKVKDEKLFDKVLFVEVKHHPIKIIQNQIAYMVGLHFDTQSETELTRADRLRLRLEREKSLLIVLDDLWQGLDFNQVGIPSADEPNTQRKFIFTSRDAILLSSLMNCKRNVLVELLSEEEAWVLFKKMAEINEYSDDSNLVLIANEVSQECAGLPVAIVTVARALRNNKSPGYWRDALQRLKSFSSRNNRITEELDDYIKLSYDSLKNKELKSTFLLSAMSSQHPLIMDVFMYAVGLGFLEDVQNMEKARNRLNALVYELKASSLLLDSYSEDRFTIHDVVRNVALSIVVKEQHALVKRHEKVDEWPEDQLERCTAICLDESDINELPEEFYGPKVEFFYLYSKDLKLSMPRNFFRGMQELKVLSLSEMTFSSLPSSISLLEKLVTLSLRSCILEDITGVKHLKKLKILNLSDSRIKELPCEVGQLSDLKILNLSNCYRLNVIPPNILSNLKKLEELYMGQSFNKWKAEGINEGKDTASLDELKNLQKLSALEIDIPNASVLRKDFLLESSLERYKISIGECCQYYYSYKFSRTLRLVANNNIDMEYGVFRLFENVEDLYLQNLNGIASLYQSHVAAQTFCKLRAIKVTCCDQLKSLFLVSMAGALSKLERIEVSECKSLEEIVVFSDEGNVVKGSAMNVIEFLQLRSLKLNDLPALTDYCFNNKVTFPNLETLHLTSINCQSIFMLKSGEIQISEVESSQINSLERDATFVFPKLRKLKVENCYKLKIFQSELWSTKDSLFLDEKVIPKLEVLSLNGMHAKMVSCGKFRGLCFLNVKFLSLSKIHDKAATFPYSLFHGFPNLEQLQLSCSSFEVMFSCSERPLDKNARKTMSIKGLELSRMKQLKHIWDGKCQVDHILQNLETLYVSGCHNLISLGSSFVSLKNLIDLNVFNCDELINLLTPSTAQTLVQLTRLKIEGCKKMEEIITDGEDDVEKEIVFNKLKILELDGLSSCKSFCCYNHNFKFPLLDDVTIKECPKFIRFCLGDLITPLLKGVKFGDRRIRWQSNLNKTIRQLFDEKVWFTGLPVKVDEYPVLIDVWNRKCEVSNLSFSSLTSLIMDKCTFLFKYVIPSYILISLINLEKLEVRNCDSVEVVFDLEGIDIDKEAHTLQAIPLRILVLRHLSNLKCVWNKDPHTVHCFQDLDFISAYECKSLRSIFPAFIAKGLVNLSTLKIESCGVEVIVAEDYNPSPTIHFVFPQLRFLYLIKLPNLKNFYPQRHTVEWPSLAYKDVRLCKKVKVFSWENPKITEKETEDGVENQYPLFLIEKVIPKLFRLVLNQDHVKIIRNGQSQNDLFNEVQILDLECFNEDESIVFPYAFLEEFPKLTNLNVSHSSFKDIFPCYGPPNDPSRNVPLFTSLFLTHLDQLQNIWNKDSKTYPVLQSLKNLGVICCYRLINLAPSSASFDNLRRLTVSGCHHLSYLLTTSTAKSLVCLQRLVVEDCKMMEEIVTNEGKDLEDLIGLKKLNAMKLIDLPTLKNFCSQTCTFEFLALTDVTIRECFKMKMFCPGVLATPLLNNVKVEEYEERWEGNLNETLEKLFLEKQGENSLEG